MAEPSHVKWVTPDVADALDKTQLYLMTTSTRPRVAPPHSRFEYALEVVSVLAVVAAVVFPWHVWDLLPERIPSHFGATGKPDAYGSKGNILTPSVLTAALYVLLSAIQWMPPHLYNFPVQITAENSAVQYRLARDLMATVKVGMSVALACSTWLTVEISLGHREGMGVWFLPAALTATFLPLVIYGVAAYRRRRA